MKLVSVNTIIKQVPVLIGAADELVSRRELRTSYETNRSIKTWAAFFLLKSLTTSGYIKNWIDQKADILSYCKMNEQTFRARLRELIALKLVSVDRFDYSISLESFEDAAEILGITYEGTIKIDYDISIEGKQIFQYILRAEEIRGNQRRQLDALNYYADKNPLLKQQLILLLAEKGGDVRALENDPKYFQVKLLSLQQDVFRHGSTLFKIIHSLRADINRSVSKIRDDHKYKSASSVSYMKSIMIDLGVIDVQKLCILSPKRSRLYVPVPGERRRDGFKWIPHLKKTAWFLTDQITLNFKTDAKEKKKFAPKTAA